MKKPPTPARVERELTAEAQADRDDFDRNHDRDCCSCHLSPPCGFCTHPGNPLNQEEDDNCFVEPAAPATRKFCELPLGTRFRYAGTVDVFVVLERHGRGLVADDVPPDASAALQGIYTAADSEAACASLEVEVLDVAPALVDLHAECQRVAHNAIHDAIHSIDACEPVKAAVRNALDGIDLAGFAP